MLTHRVKRIDILNWTFLKMQSKSIYILVILSTSFFGGRGRTKMVDPSYFFYKTSESQPSCLCPYLENLLIIF